MLNSEVYIALEKIYDTLISIIKIAIWILTLPLVMIFLYYWHKAEEEARKNKEI